MIFLCYTLFTYAATQQKLQLLLVYPSRRLFTELIFCCTSQLAKDNLGERTPGFLFARPAIARIQFRGGFEMPRDNPLDSFVPRSYRSPLPLLSETFREWLASASHSQPAEGTILTVPEQFLWLPCNCSIGVMYKGTNNPLYQKEFHLKKVGSGWIHVECGKLL